MSHAVQHNLPIFNKSQVIPYNGKFYTEICVGFDTYLGCMRTSPRKDYFAFLNEFNGFKGTIRIGRLDSMDILRKKVEVSTVSPSTKILIEVIPNRYDSIIDLTEFVPKMKAGYLTFRSEEVRMTFFEWVSSMVN